MPQHRGGGTGGEANPSRPKDENRDSKADCQARLDEVIARRVAQERGWAEGTFEVSGNEGASAIVDLDVCVVQREWSAYERRHWEGRLSFVALDVSRPFHIELRAAREFLLRPPKGGRAEAAAVGEWPLRVAAPPVEWLGYPGCDALPERFTAETTCVHVEHLTVRDEPFPLCDRLTLVPSAQLTGAIHARLHDHLAVGVHSEERWFEVEDGGEYVVTLDVCVLDSDIARAPNSAPTIAYGLIDPRRKRRVEIERARFRYRWRAEGPFQEGRLGEALEPTSD